MACTLQTLPGDTSHHGNFSCDEALTIHLNWHSFSTPLGKGMKKPRDPEITPQESVQAPIETSSPSTPDLSAEERAALEMEVSWIRWRSEFRKAVISSKQMRAPWRNIFEADAITSLIVLRWLSASPITLKELAAHLSGITTEATISRHLDDLEYSKMLTRLKDPADNRRLFLIPTEKLILIGRRLLQGRVTVMKQNGFGLTDSSNE